MKLTYRIDDRVTIEVEGDTQVDVFEQLARATEVFGDNTCKARINGEIRTSDQVKFVVRENKDGDKFYEKVCTDWDAKLVGFKKSFGCHKKGGGLFPKEMPEQEKINRVPGLNQWYKIVKNDNQSQPQTQPVSTSEDAPF